MSVVAFNSFFSERTRRASPRLATPWDRWRRSALVSRRLEMGENELRLLACVDAGVWNCKMDTAAKYG